MNDSVSIRTDTTLDQDCACVYSVHDRVIVDNVSEFEHSSSGAGCTFSMQDSRVKRGNTNGHKTQQARLPAASPGQLHLDHSSSQNFLLLVALIIALALLLAVMIHSS